MTQTTKSVAGVPIRLTDERWAHIVEEHGEMSQFRQEILDTVGKPDAVYGGGDGELLAVRTIPSGKRLVSVYRETNGDGFIITAFATSKVAALERRKRIWP